MKPLGMSALRGLSYQQLRTVADNTSNMATLNNLKEVAIQHSEYQLWHFLKKINKSKKRTKKMKEKQEPKVRKYIIIKNKKSGRIDALKFGMDIQHATAFDPFAEKNDALRAGSFIEHKNFKYVIVPSDSLTLKLKCDPKLDEQVLNRQK